MRVLVFAAHPDDELLGLGGTVARHSAAGDDVTAVIAAEGTAADHAEGAARRLEEHARAAARILGVRDVRFLRLPDQRLDTLPLLELTARVETAVREVAPEVVYTHHWGDLNRDHRIVCEAVQVACRPVGTASPRRLYCFETPSSSEWGTPDSASQFVPTRFVDVTGTVEAKLRAMACYETAIRAHPHPRSLEALRARAATWGSVIGRPYAEPFVLVREVD
jgi:LmbE family N-acetylglucosaminyl deacetylase